MKKYGILCTSALVLFFMSRSVFGQQWATAPNGTDIYNTNSGNVGIGTSTPGAKLSVNANRAVFGGTSILGAYGASAYGMELQATGTSGNVFFGLVGGISGSNGQITYLITAPQFGYTGISSTKLGTASYLPFTISVGGGERMRILTNGNVLIAKTSQTNSNYKLDVNGVNGFVRANEVVVNTTGADFVFEENYPLMSLKDLEQHIKTKKHLPGIPTEKEMKENDGVSLGEMQSKLLQKIEELTLYIIELNDENHSLKERLVRLETQFKENK